jgi:hypothetical protein
MEIANSEILISMNGQTYAWKQREASKYLKQGEAFEPEFCQGLQLIPIKSAQQSQPIMVSEQFWLDPNDGYLSLEQGIPRNDTAIMITGHLGPLVPLTFNKDKYVRIVWAQPLDIKVSAFKIEILTA